MNFKYICIFKKSYKNYNEYIFMMILNYQLIILLRLYIYIYLFKKIIILLRLIIFLTDAGWERKILHESLLQ